ncbi:MAG: glutamate racemase, partial [Gemmatimonadaceae bacterium]
VDLPIVGAIDPVSRAAARTTRSRRVGVIGTQGTIASGAYERAIHAVASDIDVVSRACPLFVPFVEEGWLDHAAVQLVAHDYLNSLASAGIDTLVLGCTHYPLLKPIISAAVGPDIQLIDSAEETAAETARMLTDRGLRHPPRTDRATLRFIASDVPDQFLRLGQRFLGSAIHNVETVTLG